LAAGALQPQRRELVFDIDMTDYDEIRTCCTDKKICRRCWGYIAAAVKVLDHSLRGESTMQNITRTLRVFIRRISLTTIPQRRSASATFCGYTPVDEGSIAGYPIKRPST